MSASTAFEAQYSDTCARCRRGIEPGELVRYVDDDLVHLRHPITERVDVICLRCWLAKPCECD